MWKTKREEHYRIQDEANRLFWQIFTEAVQLCLAENRLMAPDEIEKRAEAIADKAREEFVTKENRS